MEPIMDKEHFQMYDDSQGRWNGYHEAQELVRGGKLEHRNPDEHLDDDKGMPAALRYVERRYSIDPGDIGHR